jgi:hypothetical protein
MIYRLKACDICGQSSETYLRIFCAWRSTFPGGSPVSELTMEMSQSESERGKRGREGIRGGGTRKREGEENSVPQYNCITSVL